MPSERAFSRVLAYEAVAAGVRELGRLDQHEDDKDDVGLADIGAELPGRLRPLDEPFDQRRVALAGHRDQIPAGTANISICRRSNTVILNE